MVLLLQPAAVLGASFQMSFAAVMAIIAGWEWLRPRLPPRERRWPGLLTTARPVLLVSVRRPVFSVR